MSFKVVIPARYASTRLPGKPLLEIAGKPMVVHVIEKAIASGAEAVVVATDDEQIKAAVQGLGYEVVMTSSSHLSGTDRIAEVVEKMQWANDEIIVNVQGDEPLIEPDVISAVANRLHSNADCVCATACFKLDAAKDFYNPNVVKVVLSAVGKALYFSRAPIPFPRDVDLDTEPESRLVWDAYQHIGLYAYRVGFLKTYTTLPATALEQVEKLEQLRILHHGYQMIVHQVDGRPAPGIDTPEDLEKVRKQLQ